MIGRPFPKTHGMSQHKLYYIHKTMIARCHNPNARGYERYGGKGITVCEEWRKDRCAFFEWALTNGYEDGLTLDRRDNSKGYSPDNCRWASRKQQANNRGSNHIICINGESHTLSEWAELKNINKNTLCWRLKNGWTEEKAIMTPALPLGSWRKKGEANDRHSP